MQEITVEWECAGCHAKNIAELRDVIALWASSDRSGVRGTKVFLRCEGCEQETFVRFVGRPPHTASPAQIDAYLVSRGWRRESQDRRWANYTRHTRHHMIQTIVVPQMHDASDYSRAVDFMLVDLAWIEGRLADEIAREIRATKVGVP